MAMVDNGIIVRTESPWLKVKPICPHCGHMEQSDWNLVSVGSLKTSMQRNLIPTPVANAERDLELLLIMDN